jgi:hypothetical protein
MLLTSAVAGEWSASRLGHFTPGGNSPITHCIGCCVDPRAGLDDMKLSGFSPQANYTNRAIAACRRS